MPTKHEQKLEKMPSGPDHLISRALYKFDKYFINPFKLNESVLQRDVFFVLTDLSLAIAWTTKDRARNLTSCCLAFGDPRLYRTTLTCDQLFVYSQPASIRRLQAIVLNYNKITAYASDSHRGQLMSFVANMLVMQVQSSLIGAGPCSKQASRHLLCCFQFHSPLSFAQCNLEENSFI